MKALKEKRISLRSLWRRGLVILSLFALVFVSCGDSDSGSNSDGGAAPAKRVGAVLAATGPTATQYYGRPVDLTGATVTVQYTDGETKIIKAEDEPQNFTAWPRLVTGKYANDGSFTGMSWITLTYCDGVRTYPADVRLGGAVRGIARQDARRNWDPDRVYTNTGTPGTTLLPGMYANDLSVVINGPITEEAYVDQTMYDFSGLIMQATYSDGKILSINPRDVTWRIIPYYPAGKDADGVYSGFVQIMVGKDTEGMMTLGSNESADGITYEIPIPKVYTVEKIELVDELPDDFGIFYWEPNTFNAWADKIGKQLSVTYTNGTTKTFEIADLKKKANIWWNPNPYIDGYNLRPEVGSPEWTEWYTRYWDVIDLDFYIIPIKYPLPKKAVPTQITVWYRGAQLPVDAYVFTKYLGLEVDPNPNPPEQISVDLIGYERDNDIEGKVAERLAGKVTVRAQYGSYYPADEVQKYAPLTYESELTATYAGPFYTTNWDEVYPGKLKRSGDIKNVKFTHTVMLDAVVARLNRLTDPIPFYEEDFQDAVKPANKKISKPVMFIFSN